MTTRLATVAPLRPGVPVKDVARHPGDCLLYNQSTRRPQSASVEREHSVIAHGPIVAVTDRQQSRIGIGGG
jgi:hypothetical protein